MTESKWNTKFSKLLVLAFLLILLPIVNATSFGYNYLKNNPSGDQDLSTYVEGNMSAETYNETTIIPTTNYSLSFDGINDYISVDTSLYLNKFTFSFWVKPTPYKKIRFIAILQDKDENLLRIFQDNAMSIEIDQKPDEIGNKKCNISDNVWQHIVITYNGSNLRAYNDGIEYGSGVYANFNFEEFTKLRIGADTLLSYPFNGSLDEVLIFNRSLSSDEISQLYNSGNGLYANTSIAPFNDGLVAGYHFDEGTGTTAYDITGRNNGTLVNGPTWVDGKISHNLTSTTETLGAKGLMPYITANNFISTDYALKWDGSLLLNIWNTISTLGNSTNRWNIFAWNLTADKYFSSDGSQGWTGNCVNASYKNGIVVGCND